MDRLPELNAAQSEAVAHVNGPCVLFAGPGAGKTAVLTRRAALLVSTGVQPERILLLTFTRASAKEMMRRAAVIEPLCERLSGGTFHAIGTKIINQNAHIFGMDKPFTVLDRDESLEIIKRLVEPLRAGSDNWPRPSLVRAVISYAANTRASIEDSITKLSRQHLGYADAIREVRDAYVAYKLDRGMLDYDDALEYFAALLEDPEIGPILRSTWDYVMIDEYQDTNALQLDIVYGLAGDGGNVMVVGDPCQPEHTLVARVRNGKASPNLRKSLADVEQVAIKDLKEGDSVVGYDVSSSSFVHNRIVQGVTRKPYKGNLVRVTMPGVTSSEYTPNHHCLASFKPLEGRHAVYLMRKGDRYRIGRAQMSYDVKPSLQCGTVKRSGSGPISRAKAEKADALWLLETYESDQDAAVAEYSLQTIYGVPGLTFISNGVLGRGLDAVHLEQCWNEIAEDSIGLRTRAEKCLTAFNRSIEYPLWESCGYASLKRPGIYRACNLMNGCAMLPHGSGVMAHTRRSDWRSVDIDHVAYDGYVYSLTISHNELYVGDGIVTHNCQSIFGFRGSAPSTMTAYRDRFPGCKVVMLETNYRSTAPIVNLANIVDRRLQTGFERTLRSASSDRGARPSFVETNDEMAQAKAIVDAILEHKAAGGEISENAVIVRAMSWARTIEAEMTSRRVPYRVVGGLKIDEAAHVKDLLSLARLATNLRHEPAWLRILKRHKGVGDVAAARLTDELTRAHDMPEAVSILVRAAQGSAIDFEGLPLALAELSVPERDPTVALEAAVVAMDPFWRTYKEWRDDWAERRRDFDAILLVAAEHLTLEGFLTAITLDASLDKKTSDEERQDEKPVTITTIHGAKGLEWDSVHIPSFVRGHMPAGFADDPDEELRLLYVALTRARRDLRVYRQQFDRSGGFASMSEFERIIRPHMESVRIVKRAVDGGPIATGRRIDMSSRLLGRK